MESYIANFPNHQ